MSPSAPATGATTRTPTTTDPPPTPGVRPGSVDEFAVAATLRRVALLLLATTAAFLSWMLGGTDASNQTPQAPAGTTPSSGQSVDARPAASAGTGHTAPH